MLDVSKIRTQFPALHELYNGKPAIFFDNPGGTQVPQRVVDAVADAMVRRNSNTGGVFETSRRTDALIEAARQAAADLLGAEPNEIIFGNNMTSLAFQLSRSLAHRFVKGDEIVVTRLDHDANVSPWTILAEETGATVRFADVDLETCTLDMDHLQSLINPNTKLVAVGYASNASGTINDVKTVIEWAKSVNAYTVIDAVQYAAHGLIDVKELQCDFLLCSAYKFFGPHVGVLYARRELLDRLRTYKVRAADDDLPARWEQGTRNHEGLAGLTAAVDYLADLGSTYGGALSSDSRRARLRAAFTEINNYEQQLVDQLISGLQVVNRVRIYGITSRFEWQNRLPTVSIRKEGTTPEQLALALANENIFAWHGNFYALNLSEALGVEMSGGLLRLGLVHYNTPEEIDRCMRVLERV